MIGIDDYLEKTAVVTSVFKPFGAALGALLDKAKPVVPWLVGGTAVGAGLGATGILGGLEGKRQGDTMSYRINRGLNSLFDRIRADETAAEAFAGTMGKDTASNLMELAKDVATKGYETMKNTFDYSPARKAIFNAIKKEDEYLAGADNKSLLEAYHTMAKVAPTLSTDKNAVKSFLREAVISGGGLDFNTIKGIAEAENAVTGRGKGGK